MPNYLPLLALLSAVTISVHPLSAQRSEDVLNPNFEIAWCETLRSDERNHAIESLTYDAATDHIFVVDVTSNVQDSRDGEIWLLEFEASGRKVGEWLLSRREPDEVVPATFGLIAGIIPQPNDELLIIGKFDSNRINSVIKVNAKREVLWSKPLSQKITRADFKKALLMPDGNILIVGTFGRQAVLVALNGEGNVNFIRSYKRENNSTTSNSGNESGTMPSVSATFSDILAVNDGANLIIVGQFGEPKRGKSDVNAWALRCSPMGDIEKEQTFPGRFPRLAGLSESGDVILLYDLGRDIMSDWQLARLNEDMKTSWAKPVDVGQAAPYYPCGVKLTKDRFMVAGGVEDEVRIREFDSEGVLLTSLEQTLSGSVSGATLVANVADEIAVSVKTFSVTDKHRPRIHSDLCRLKHVNEKD